MATVTTKVSKMEQVVGGLAARAARCSFRLTSGSWPLLGKVDGSTVTLSEEVRNTRRRLDKDISPDDEKHEAPSSYRFSANNASQACQSRSPEYREIGGRFCTALEKLATKLLDFLRTGHRIPSHCSTIDCRAQVLNLYDRRYGVGKPVFKVAPVGHEQLFNIICLGFSVPHI